MRKKAFTLFEMLIVIFVF
nr:prepilin-type N-terminal cleavage/methylation domain-containing protein [bacterium]